MSIHYNAFISYRHHPDDIRVASDIHRSLERFHVPKSIRKKTGQIKRLFRDKEELPITSNLSDDIGTALKNSDYLIVICSVHTKESIWVQREIELFLQSHDRSKVLTVLASGEPYDVIPEILLYEYVVDPVTGESVRRDVEPLSCDWRMKRSKAVREELPRLAAALLGCGYDELRQRQKQYRARRNMAIISTALAASMCLTAYFLYTSITIQRANVQIQKANEEIKAANIRIQANLDQALINQSMHLSTAARERLSEGDRLTAISLAMAALPGQDNDRPYVPEAENVLVSALGLYNTTGSMAAVGTVSPGMNVGVLALYVTPSEQVLYLYDQRQVITAWDAQTLQKLGQIPQDSYPRKVLMLPNDNAVILGGTGGTLLRCYQPDGTLVWERDKVVDVALLSDGEQLLVIQSTGDSYALVRLDSVTGQAVDSVSLDIGISDASPSGFLADTVPANTPVPIQFYTGLFQASIYVLDPATGSCTVLDTETASPALSLIADDGKLILLGYGSSMGLGGVYEGNRITEAETAELWCHDLFTGELLWKSQITSCVASGTDTLTQIPGSSNILCQKGNVFMVLDRVTGETVASCEAGSGVMAVTAMEQYATAVLQDGYLCKYWYDLNYCYEVKCLKDQVSCAYVNEGCYTSHWDGDSVTVSRNIIGTPAWEAPFANSFSVNGPQVWGDYLAFQDSSRLYLFDMESKTLLWETQRGSKELLGFSSDGTKLWYAEGKEQITWVDIATGSWETLAVETGVDSATASVRSKLYFDGERLCYTVGGLEKPILVTWNPTTGQKDTCQLSLESQDIAYWSWEVLARQGQYLWLWGQQEVLLEVDMTSGTVCCILEETAHRPVIALQGSEKVAIAHQGEILTKVCGKDEISVISLESANAGSLYFLNGELLALCDNGFLYRFDGSGAELSGTELQVGSSFSSNLLSSYADRSKLSWYLTDNNELIVNALGEGNIIDCDTWSVKATVSGLLMYSRDAGLVCKQGNALAGYPIYGTEQLLQLAEAELSGFMLSAEQKAAYGLDG